MTEKKRRLFVAFMDLEKAYDKVDRDGMWQVMRINGVSGNVLRGIKSFYDDGRACLRVGGEVSESFRPGAHTSLLTWVEAEGLTLLLQPSTPTYIEK